MLLYLAVEKCSFDDQQFITDIYFRFKPAMVAIAQNYVSNQHDIEDIIQASILRLIPRVSMLQTLSDHSLSAYVSYTLKSVAINHSRHQKIVMKHSMEAPLKDDHDFVEYIKDPGHLPDSIMIAKESAEQFVAVFSTLSADDQFLLQGKYVLELTDQELADILKCKASSIRMMLTRARRHARELFSNEEGTYDKP